LLTESSLSWHARIPALVHAQYRGTPGPYFGAAQPWRLSCVAPFPVLVLGHTGAKSGLARTSTVVYFTDQGWVIVIASNFGSARHPSWYYNVKVNQMVTLDGGRFNGRFRW